MTSEPRPQDDETCRRASAALLAAFPRDLEPNALAGLDAHAAECATCAGVIALAREQERLLRAWTVPLPTARTTDRLVAALAIDAAQRAVCARKRDALEHALRDERVDAQVATLRAHVQQCAHCAEVWAVDHEADRVLRAWPVPTPPAGFVESVLARLRSARFLRRPSAGLRVASAAAAAVLLGAFAWLCVAVPPNPTPNPTVAVDVDRALERFGGDVHVVHVMNSQFPAGIGSFAPTAVALERAPTQPGAGFLRALRKVRRDAASGDGR